MTDTDPPIIDVPISGGIQYGKTPSDFTGVADDPGGGTQWMSYSWFNPIAMFCNDPSVSEAECQKWCRRCSDAIVPELVNNNTLTTEPVDVPGFTPANVQALGLCQIFWIWMWSLYVSQHTGVAENPTPPSYDPLDGPGGGGGPPGG